MRARAPLAPDSLYGEETEGVRLWAKDYIARNRDLLDLMARL
ncbi:MAG: hypothetical protein ABR586_10505 [Thermoplasmatota archaeon]